MHSLALLQFSSKSDIKDKKKKKRINKYERRMAGMMCFVYEKHVYVKKNLLLLLS